MLHHCLSAEHVLVGENQVCKITGYGLVEDVLERERYEGDNGVSSKATPWSKASGQYACHNHSQAFFFRISDQ